MHVSAEALDDIKWWLEKAFSCPRPIITPPVFTRLFTDASNEGWGAVRNDVSTGGHWSEVEKLSHINVLELLAIQNGLLSLCRDLENVHVEIHSDNTTAVAYINDMGGCRSMACNEIARSISLWAHARNIWLSALHVPGELNTVADSESRILNDRTEWHLDKNIFRTVCDVLVFSPDIDLFASRLNCQVPIYVAWKPDPCAVAINAFNINWSSLILSYFLLSVSSVACFRK